MTEKIMLFIALMILILPLVATTQTIDLEKYKGLQQTMTRVRVASTSILPDKWDKETNWRRIETMVREAAVEGGAQVVVTPEGALEGYVINEVNAVNDEEEKKEMVDKFLDLGEPLDGPYIPKACALSRELDICFILGFLERREEKLFNTAILIDPDGDIIGRYSKTHFAQGYTINPSCYKPGDVFPIFDTPFGKVGMLICYDRQLPEPARILAIKGAKVLFLPSYGSYTNEDGWNTVLLRARAYENRFYLIFSHPFQSLMITDRGELKSIGKAGEIAYYEINTSPDRNEGRFRNRRPEMYTPLTMGGKGKRSSP